jgi:hypothetical protein
MSTITTTPVPSLGRKPFVIGLAVVGVLTVGAVALPHVHLGATTTTPTVTQAQAPDALDRRDAMAAAAAAQSSLAVERMLDASARTLGHGRGTAIVPALVGTSVAQQQIGGQHLTYPFSGRGRAIVPSLVGASVAQQQVGGQHQSYPFTGSTGSSSSDYTASGRKLHLTWTDPYVPPVADPDWKPFIRAHYYGGTVSERVVTRGD